MNRVSHILHLSPSRPVRRPPSDTSTPQTVWGLIRVSVHRVLAGWWPGNQSLILLSVSGTLTQKCPAKRGHCSVQERAGSRGQAGRAQEVV